MKQPFRRTLSVFLTIAMLFSMTGMSTAFATETGQTVGTSGLCEHHTEHTADCGYTEGTRSVPCAHEHTDECYKDVTDCVHEHTEDCYPAEDDESDNEATPSNADHSEPTECTHVCSEESGCITQALDCQHEHDAECGFVAAVPGTPCAFVCEECAKQDSGQQNPSANVVKAVQDLIDALPDAQDITADNADDISAQLDEIDNAKAELSDEQLDELDFARYDAAIAALTGLAAPAMLSAAAPKNGDGYEIDLAAITGEETEADSAANGYYIGGGGAKAFHIVLNQAGPYRLTGTSAYYVKVTTANASITLDNVEIPCADSFGVSLEFTGSGASASLTLSGTNTLSGTASGVLGFPADGQLTIDGAGSLTANSVKGSSGNGTFTVNGGTVNVKVINVSVLNIAGGAVNVLGASNNSNVLGAGSISISGGTVSAVNTGTNGNAVNSWTQTFAITGGSVRLAGTIDITRQPKKGETPLYMTAFAGMPADTEITDMTAPADWGVNDMKTDGDGKLYLWLPVGDGQTISLTAGGAVYSGTANVADNNTNTATLTTGGGAPTGDVTDADGLKAALVATTPATISVTADIAIAEAITLGAGHTLHIADGVTVTTGNYQLTVPAGKTLTLDGLGTLEVNNSGSTTGISVAGALTVTGGTLKASNTTNWSKGISVADTGTLTLTGAGALEVNSANGGPGVYNSGTVNVSGGTVNVKHSGGSSCGIENDGGELNVSGGTVNVQNTGANSHGIKNGGSTMTVSGGTVNLKNITGTDAGIYNLGGSTLAVSGGTVNVENGGGSGIDNFGGAVTVSNSTVNVKNSGGTGIYNSNDGTLAGGEGGKLTLTAGATLYGVKGVFKDQLADFNVSTSVTVGAADAAPSASGLSAGDYLWNGAIFAKGDTGGGISTATELKTALEKTVPAAIDVAGDITMPSDITLGASHTLTIAQGVTVSTGEEFQLTIPAGKALTLDGPGTLEADSRLTGKKGISVSGTLTVSDGTLEVANSDGFGVAILSGGAMNLSGGTVTVQNSGTGTGISTGGGSLTVSSGTLNVRNTGTSTGVNNGASGSLTVSGGAVNVQNVNGTGIRNAGAMTVSGGTVTVDFGGGSGVYNEGTLTGEAGGKFTLAESARLYGVNGKFNDRDVDLTATAYVTVGAAGATASADGLSAGDYVWDSGKSLFAKGGDTTDVYDPGDVAVINAIIENNELEATKDDPAGWATNYRVAWDNSSPKRITWLNLYHISLTGTLDVSGLASLQDLNCGENQLTALNVSGLTSLRELHCDSNQLTTLDVSGLTSLQELHCGSNQLTALDVNGLTSLQTLSCYSNQLTTLDVSGLTNLQELACTSNKLTALDVSSLTSLQTLVCTSNKLTTLDVSGLTSLQTLECASNQLTALDVSRLTELQVLSCESNKLTALDVSGLTNLQGLWCESNKLTALDVSGLTSLTSLKCNYNPLASLKLSEGKELTVPATAGGTVELTLYTHSTKAVYLKATADSGYTFEKWTASGTTLTNDVANPVQFTLDGNITVTPSYTGGAPTGITTAADLKAALEATEAATISVTADIAMADIITLGASHTLHIADGKTVSTGNYQLEVPEGKTLTLGGPGTLEANNSRSSGIVVSGTLKLEADSKLHASNSGQYSVGVSIGDSSTLTGCGSITVANSGENSSGITGGGSVNLTGGTLTVQNSTGYGINGLALTTSNTAIDIQNTGGSGLMNRSVAVTGGTVRVANGGTNSYGIEVLYGCSLTLTDANLTAENTAGTGISFDYDSSTTLGNSTVTLQNTGGTGMSLEYAALTMDGSSVIDVKAATTSANSGLSGLGDDTRTVTNGAKVTLAENAKIGGVAFIFSDRGFLSPYSGDLTVGAADATASEDGLSAGDYVWNGSAFAKGGGSAATHQITVTNGTASPTTAAAGETVTITAGTAPTGQRFKEWTITPAVTFTDGTSKTSATAKFTMLSQAVTAAATFENIPVTIAGVTLNPATANVQKGTTRQFNATVTGTGSFVDTVNWTVTGGGTGTSISSTGLLTVAAGETASTLTVKATSTADGTKSASATVTVTGTPVTTYLLTVTGGTGGGNYESGAQITITANAPAAGKVFDKWTGSNGGTFANASSATTTFTMPAGAATVTATYKDAPTTTYTLTVNGSYASTNGSGAYAAGTAVSISAGSRSGYSFNGWSSNNGGSFANANSASTTYTMPAGNVTVTAAWKSTGGGGGGGGSSSGGSSSSGGGTTVTTPPATSENPNPPTDAKTDVPGKVDTNGNATVTVPEKSVTDALKAAQDAAKKAGTEKNGVTVTVNVQTDKAASSIAATLPQNAINELVKAGVTELKIQSSAANFTLDLATLKQIQAAGSGNLVISASKMDNAKLPQAARAAIGNRPVFNLTATIGGKAVTNFGIGSVSVALPYTLGTNEKPGNLYGVFVDDSGKVTYLTNSSYDANAKMLRFSTNHFSTFGIGYKADAPKFTDITNHWAKDDIEFVAARGLLNGTGEAAFSPDGSMTRGMFVTALGRLAGIDPNSYKTGKFTDVAADAYYAPYVNWAADKGIVSGTGEAAFAPDQNVTREQMAVIMANYAKAMGYTVPKTREAVTFADNGSIGSWAKDAVKAMQMAGVINGKNGNRFDPQGTATRAQVAAVLHRYVELVIDPATAQGWTQNDSGQWLYYQNGKPVTGWKQVDGKWYYLDTAGLMQSGGWKQIGGKWYYLYADGMMAANTKIDGYEIGADGAWKE